MHTAHSPSFIAYLPPERPRTCRSQKGLPIICRRFSKGRALTAHHSAKAQLHGPNFEEAQLHHASIGQSTQLHGVQTFKEPSLTARQSGRAQLRSAQNFKEPSPAARQSDRAQLRSAPIRRSPASQRANQTEPSLTARQSDRAQLRSAPIRQSPASQRNNRTEHTFPAYRRPNASAARFTLQQEANSRGTRASTSIESVSTRKCSPCPVLGKHAAAIVPSACAGCSAGPLQSRTYPGARGGFLNFRS